jgi:16S rRNA U516 pseudouridylate synthase RsuA-like enzyme
MRLNKYISQAGIASRRKADELTLQGKVRINGAVMKEPGYDVKEDDVVEVNGRKIMPDAKKVYVMLNKPIGFITSHAMRETGPGDGASLGHRREAFSHRQTGLQHIGMLSYDQRRRSCL